MRNDKTLADVQPGGMVRLGDALPPLPKPGYFTGGDYGHEAHNAYTPEQMRDYARAVLSAQPSPGGQGDALVTDEMVQAACKVWAETPGQGEDWMRTALQAALAARQPVGEPVARLIEAVEGECDGLVISMETAAAILAHVSPAAYTPAAYMVDGRIEQGLFFDRAAAETMAAMNAGEVVPLFRSPAQAVDLGGNECYGTRYVPPEQAVDLGQLPRAVELLSNVARTLVDWAADEQREAIGIVKALIDSQAVGK